MEKIETKIEVFRREEIGRKDLKQLRADGFIPGIYYAHDQAKAIPFKVEQKEFHTAMQQDALVYQISVADKRRNVLIKEIQYHPVTEEILHVDFQGVRMDEEVHVRVPVHILGDPVGVKDEGGQIHHALLEVEIKCRAGDIPSHFDIDITDLHLGESIHVDDMDLGGAEVITAADTLVVAVSRARGMTIEEPVAAEAEEGEEFLFEEEAEEKAEEAEGPAEQEQSPEA